VSDGTRSEIKVGLFVLLTAVAAVIVVFLLGRKRHVWEERVHIHSTFDDVGGLVVGAPVQLAGVNVGIVSSIAFDRTTPRPRIRVDLEIARASLDLIHRDSIARIGAQGLLGDKLVDVSAGTRTEPPIEEGGEVAAAPSSDLQRLIAETTEVMDRVKRVAENLAKLTAGIAEPKTVEHLRGSIASLHQLMEQTVKGPGLMHALFYDPRTAEQLDALLVEARRLVAHVDQGVVRLDQVLGATNAEGRQILNYAARAARAVGDTAEALGRTQTIANVERASADLADVARTVRSGQGTLGALVQDPTVYEQLVTILGGIARSRILRALVRYAIVKDDAKTAQRIVDEPPGHSTPKPPGTQTTKR
jgi:phospholipid/cholesterol/gamma-HCH transport system substrate-binding protein